MQLNTFLGKCFSAKSVNLLVSLFWIANQHLRNNSVNNITYFGAPLLR